MTYTYTRACPQCRAQALRYMLTLGYSFWEAINHRRHVNQPGAST